MDPRPTLAWLGDSALVLRYGSAVDATLNLRALAAARAIRAASIRGVVDVVPAYASVMLTLDPRAAATRSDAIEAEIDRCVARVRDAPVAATGRLVAIGVAYGAEHGPDLARVAAHAGLSADDVIARHAAVEYRVAMIGFQPGFPYLLGLDTALATPRLERPRTRVPPGSVGIAGAQTGIYPAESPGGWNLIGRTGAALFDPARVPATLLAPGDRVRFEPVASLAHARARIEAGG